MLINIHADKPRPGVVTKVFDVAFLGNLIGMFIGNIISFRFFSDDCSVYSNIYHNQISENAYHCIFGFMKNLRKLRK